MSTDFELEKSIHRKTTISMIVMILFISAVLFRTTEYKILTVISGFIIFGIVRRILMNRNELDYESRKAQLQLSREHQAKQEEQRQKELRLKGIQEEEERRKQREEAEELAKKQEEEALVKELTKDAITCFKVTHERGLPGVPSNAGTLMLFLKPDRILLAARGGIFKIDIEHSKIIDIKPAKIEIGGVLQALTGVNASTDLPETSFNISFEDDTGTEHIARFSMSEGWLDATKSNYVSQFMELLQPYRKYFKGKPQIASDNHHDIASKIEKLSALHKNGMITDDEFSLKKSELLSKF